MALTQADLALRAKAKKAGVPGYERMSRDELKEALADGGTRKASKGKRKSAAAIERKPARKRSDRKSSTAISGRKRGRPKGSKNKSVSDGAAKPVESIGLSERQAKRIVNKYKGKRGRRPAEFHEAMSVLGEETETAAKPKSKRKQATARASRNGDAGRNLIDKSAIDWSAEWNGGQSGNRGKIMSALRRFKGDYAKALKHLLPDVMKMYTKSQKTGKKYSKADAVAMLKWHISRTAFDFVIGTGQHQIATNRKSDKRTAGRKPKSQAVSDNGDVQNLSDQKLRKIVKAVEGKRGRRSAEYHAAVAELERRSGSSQKASKRKSGGKATRSTAKRKTSAQGRTGGSKRKRQTVKR